MNQTAGKTRHRAHVASLTPGRLRFKLHPQNRDESTLKKIQSGLQSCQGVSNVRINPANGSVTMKYDTGSHSAAGVMRLLEDVDVLIESIGNLPAVDGEESGNAAKSGSFLAAVEDLNRYLSHATGIPLNFKLILPLGFVGAGLWSIGKRGLMIESVPGWLFLWFAFDMFVKLHPIPHGRPANVSPESSESD